MQGTAGAFRTARPPAVVFRHAPPLSPSARNRQQLQSPSSSFSASEAASGLRLRAAVLEKAPTQEPAVRPSPEDHQEPAYFNWTKQWYPLQSIQDMDPTKPQAAKLLGKELVLWRDGNGTWRALEDLCSHRKVPLSEGRIEPSNGTLMCSFHGWCFRGDGTCSNIPQLSHTDKRAEEAACSSSRSSVAAYPTQEKQGLLWVWGESGPAAFIEAFATPPTTHELIETYPEDKVTRGFRNYVRDLPGTADVWIDNMTDQSHVAFAHNGAVFPKKTDLLSQGKMKGFPATVGEKPEDGIRFSFTTNPAGDQPLAHFVYRPPCYCGLPAGGPVPESAPRGLWVYAVPTGANSTRLIVNFARRSDIASPFDPKGWAAIKRKLTSLITGSRWWGHLDLNDINDGDQVMLHKQSDTYKQSRTPWNRWTFSPASTDRGSVAFRQWWSKHGGNGPEYADADTAVPDPRPGSDPNRRRELLDRFTQHTMMCSACSGALKNIRIMQQLGRIAAISAAAALLVAVCSGVAIISPLSIALAAVSSAAVWARSRLHAFEQRFIFTDWRHCEIA